MENQQPIDVSDSLAKAVAKAMRRRGYAEWQIAAEALLDRLEKQGLNPQRLLITDAWGEEEDWPYYWEGEGQFTLQYFSESQEQAIKAADAMDSIIAQLIEEGMIIAIEDKSFGGGNPYRWIRANTSKS